MSTEVTLPRASTCNLARTVPRSVSTPRGKPGSTRLINLISRATAGVGLAATAGAAGAAATLGLGVVGGGTSAAATGGATAGGAATVAGAVAVAAAAAGVGATVAAAALAGTAAGAGVAGATVFLPGVAETVVAVGAGAVAALAAAVTGGTKAAVVAVAGAGVAAGATVGAAADRGSLLSALSVGPVCVDGDAVAALATAGSGNAFSLPPRSNHAEAATSARAAMAAPTIKGIRDGFSAMVARAGLALTCIGSNAVGASDCARPNLANRSSADCTSLSGSAMRCASCATDAG